MQRCLSEMAGLCVPTALGSESSTMRCPFLEDGQSTPFPPLQHTLEPSLCSHSDSVHAMLGVLLCEPHHQPVTPTIGPLREGGAPTEWDPHLYVG